ncbi:AAA family ATPase [Flavobacterium yafengii]|uniref:AAA family ATPase n=1 Tax=Flavobacterium yafengii TaxID=3041253 RepID=UPI0024A9116A|nr:AAA family ATPase [Flavobacterium yafengii]MDI5888424.1 AAA family ATPase [Flavobacterium yafengii]
MKILAIRIKNLASLEGNTEIDFTAEPLCSAGIFAITGATGAGKSTILDALCLALYGKTPRYLQAKETGIDIFDVQGSTLSQGDVRSILRDGTAEGSAEVDFIGIDGQHYRATWSVRRARNKAEGSMQADLITLKNITSHVDIPGKKQETLNEIVRLVGLNFDQFTRSVLLAQGDFTAFMKASKDEKSSLLEKLTGTHIYSEISKKIYEKYKFEEQQLRDLNFRKEGIATLNEEELKTLLEEQGVLEAQIKGLEKEIENLTTEISWHDQLAKLQGNHLEANTVLQLSTEFKVNAHQRRQKLLVAEQAQQTRSWVDAQRHAQQQHTEKTTILNTLQETITSLQEQKGKLEIHLLASETDLKAKNIALSNTLPLLEEARKLDTLLAERKEQADNAQKEAESASVNVNQQQKVQTEKQIELTNLSDKIKIITDWKTENADRSPIADNRNIILSKLQDAQKLLGILQSSTEELDVLKHKISTSETDKTIIEANLDQYTKEWESLKKTYDLQSKELLLIPIETLNLDKVEADCYVENTIKAQSNWQLFYNAITDLETLNQKQQKDQSDYKTKEKTLGELAQKLVVELAQKDTAAELLKHARLASAENVETLRETLIDNQPCPVCGSTSHPYAVHNPQLENVLAKLEEIYDEKGHLHLVSYREHVALEQVFKTLEETIQSQSEALKINEAALENKKQAWEKFDIAKENPSITNEKRAEWIEEKLQTLKTKQADLLLQIQGHAGQKQQLEASKIKIDQLKETIDSLANQVKDMRNSIALYTEQHSGKINERNKATLDLSEVEKTLSPYFTTSDWMENWKLAPSAFVEGIDSFAKIWKENAEKFTQYTLQKGAFEATLKELENQAKSLLTEFTNKTAAYTTQHQNYLNLKQQRDTIFGGKSAEEVENQIKLAVTEAQKQLDKFKEIQQELSTSSTKANTQKEELVLTLSLLEKEVQKASQKMEIWLSNYNQKNNQSLTIKELHELLTLDNDWIEAERTALKIIDDEVTKATSILLERKQLLDDHQQKFLSERSFDELNVLIKTAKSDAELQKHKRGEIGFQLQQDETNKNKIGDLLTSISTQASITENWSKLNEIIGSADGKKFRQIAQEYTLDVLLGYANIHLQVLTSRYKIERIPATLGLQVVDQDMGDEVRTVYSLSGGESFLVSLALALGLASLSSSRMKVESLFIDEGFGSLDPTTLNIAMDALERLHNQGRKVGVISHVQEMTERIPVQIKVSKQQSGKSMVEVLG